MEMDSRITYCVAKKNEVKIKPPAPAKSGLFASIAGGLGKAGSQAAFASHS